MGHFAKPSCRICQLSEDNMPSIYLTLPNFPWPRAKRPMQLKTGNAPPPTKRRMFVGEFQRWPSLLFAAADTRLQTHYALDPRVVDGDARTDGRTGEI
ncbi:hypothetical protein Y032_0350g3209 [Ancylostoma ceylanicum]|uniref:Uncharacterized protein n=1 Tax=Ancylostoma ceylanicum TaxID=53326 RepID=A0A016RWS2_9BILA|nr:hypothetical protein Y032_0350g3209 [Ancylostoma ceylanicum]